MTRKYLPTSDSLHCGLDYLKFTLLLGYEDVSDYKFFNSLFDSIDIDNSNEKVIDDFFGLGSVSLNKGVTRQGSVVYVRSHDVTVCAVLKLSDSQLSMRGISGYAHCYSIDVYGGYFSLLRLGAVTDSFLHAFSRFNPIITRLDYCLDFPLSVSSFDNYLRYTRNSCIKIWGSDGLLETISLGKKSLIKNRYLFLRVYDKKRQLSEVGRQHLYPSYFSDHEYVTRLEFEIRSQALRRSEFYYHDIFTPKLSFLVNTFLKTRNYELLVDLENGGFELPLCSPSPAGLSAGLAFFLPRIRTLVDKSCTLGFTVDEVLSKLMSEYYSDDDVS